MMVKYLAFGLCGALVACVLAAPASAQQAGAGVDVAAVRALLRDAMTTDHAKAIVAQIRVDGNNIYSEAMGESMYGVPATTAMHFRNGAMAFTYMSTMLLELVDENKVKLDDKLSKFFPDLPAADRITLRNLANMTSGYADYVYQPEVLKGTDLDPFRQWSPDELVKIGISKPMQFDPGTNWGYCHTNYVILGQVLEKVTGMPLDKAMKRYIFDRMGLHETASIDTPAIPEPVLHTFSSERRVDLGVPAGIPFYEESTFWNPSWTTAEGAVQTTDITDFSKSMEMVGTGAVLSKASFAEQISPKLVGFGHKDPSCAACREMTSSFNYGLGVVILGPWETQTKSFAGSSASVGYLPSQHLTISVEMTLLPDAFDDKGNAKTSSTDLFKALANLVAPSTLPTLP